MKNPVVEALKEKENILGVTAAVALSAAMLNPVPLLVGMVAETAYLLFVPNSRWYATRLSQRDSAEAARQQQQFRAQALLSLRPEVQNRFKRLDSVREQIASQTGNAEWLRQLDYLLDKFLQFAVKEQEFSNYLYSLPASTNRPAPFQGSRPPNRPSQQVITEVQAAYDRELQGLYRSRAAEENAATKDVLQKRIDIIERRKNSVAKLGNTLFNLGNQLQLLEDTFGLINDEVRTQVPEQVSSNIDDVVGQVDAMTKTLEEVGSYIQLTT